MKKAKNRVDANHVREAAQISHDDFGSKASPHAIGQVDNREQRNRQPPKTSGTGKGPSAQFPTPEKTRTDCGSASAETSSLETQGIVSRILANVNNSPVREEAFGGKQPICLTKRSPKVKPKPLVPVKVSSDTIGPQVIKETADKEASDSRVRKESQDSVRDQTKSGTSEGRGANVYGDVNSGRRREVKNQNLSAGGATGCIDGVGREDVCGNNNSREETRKTGKRVGASGESGEYDMCSEKGTQQCPTVLAIVKSDCNEKRNSLVEQKGSYSGRVGESDIYFGNDPEICSPPLPPSFSRDSGISSPSVDEVKPIDQRTDEPKDNEGPMRGLRGERGNICRIHDDKKGRRDSENEKEVMSGDEIVEMSLTVNNVASSTRSSFDSKQAGNRAVCSGLNLSSYPPSATLPLPESISCQGETNPVVSPMAPIVGQNDKGMVTALGIDEADTHAPMDSRLVSSDLSDDEPVTSANSTSVDATTTQPPARRHLGSVGLASATSDSTTGGFATERSALVERNVNTNKPGVGLAEQTTVLQISSSNSGTGETCTNSGVRQTNPSLSSSTEETSALELETREGFGDKPLSLTAPSAEAPAAIETTCIPKSSATLPLKTTVNSSDQRIEIEHNNQPEQERQQSDQSNLTENSSNDDVLSSKVHAYENHRQKLNSDCSVSASRNIDIAEKIKTAGVEEEGLHQKSETEGVTTKQKRTQEVITRDTEIITETCDIVTSIKSIASKNTSGPSQSEASDTLPPLKPQRARLNFRDINIQEVISLQSDSPGQKLKGILKSKSNECISGSSSCVRENGKEKLHSARSVSFKKTHTKSTFSYYNAAFEGEIKEEPSRRPSLADVVTHIMRTNSVVDIEEEEDNSHPYGRDNSLTDLINGKRRENINMDAGKMIVWLALAIMIVSLAGVIIFMSESYNLTHKEEVIYFPPDDTTLSHS